jgi:leader peptidase (prepilin peptidase)/N-methyltransferase
MNIFIYIVILALGVVFGSFFTLAVHRIPRKEDITHVRSYCPNCNHKLGFLDLIPILSYLFLGGKCRYCKEKIRIRYFLLEFFAGLVFVLIAFSRGITYESSITEIIELCIIYLFIAGAFIIAGIDKEKKAIPNGLIVYELFVGLLYLIFKRYIGMSITSNVVAFVLLPLSFPMLLVLTDLSILYLYKDENKLPFGMGDIKYITVLGLFWGFGIQVITVVGSVAIIALYVLYLIFTKEKGVAEDYAKEIPWGYYLTIALMVTIICKDLLRDVIYLLEI